MAPTVKVVTAKIPLELCERLDAMCTEDYRRNAAIGDAIAEFVHASDGSPGLRSSAHDLIRQGHDEGGPDRKPTDIPDGYQSERAALENALLETHGEIGQVVARQVRDIAKLESEIDELRAKLLDQPTARASDGDHVKLTPPKRGTQRWAVLKTYEGPKMRGQTAADALGEMERRTGKRFAQNGIAKRVSELAAAGFITDQPNQAADAAGARAVASDDLHSPFTRNGQATGAYTRVTQFNRPGTVYWITDAGVAELGKKS